MPLATGRLTLGSFISSRCLIRLGRSFSALFHVQARSKRVDVEERVLTVVDLSSGHFVHALMASIADSRQVHVGALLRDLDTLEFGIMEVESINNILNFGRLNIVL